MSGVERVRRARNKGYRIHRCLIIAKRIAFMVVDAVVTMVTIVAAGVFAGIGFGWGLSLIIACL